MPLVGGESVWRLRGPPASEETEEGLPDPIHLQAVFDSSGRCYGSRRLRKALEAKGHSVGRQRIRKLMRLNGLRPVWKRKFIHTTDSNHDLPTAANVLDRQFEPATPNAACVSDITYIRTRSSWLDLAAVMDLFSRKIVGWATAPTMHADLVCSALRIAITQRQPPAVVDRAFGSRHPIRQRGTP